MPRSRDNAAKSLPPTALSAAEIAAFQAVDLAEQKQSIGQSVDYRAGAINRDIAPLVPTMVSRMLAAVDDRHYRWLVAFRICRLAVTPHRPGWLLPRRIPVSRLFADQVIA
jgi:hypothetical protein